MLSYRPVLFFFAQLVGVDPRNEVEVAEITAKLTQLDQTLAMLSPVAQTEMRQQIMRGLRMALASVTADVFRILNSACDNLAKIASDRKDFGDFQPGEVLRAEYLSEFGAMVLDDTLSRIESISSLMTSGASLSSLWQAALGAGTVADTFISAIITELEKPENQFTDDEQPTVTQIIDDIRTYLLAPLSDDHGASQCYAKRWCISANAYLRKHNLPQLNCQNIVCW